MNRNKEDPTRQESLVLESILGSDMTPAEFFDKIWQRSCAIFPSKAENRKTSNALSELVENALPIILDLVHESMDREIHNSGETMEHATLFFRQQVSLSLAERASLYHNSAFSALLDGCSLVHNHADLLSPKIAALSQDLQKSFPHCYCNTYLTPADAQAAPEHADDRDVLIIQVYGSKEWTVYERIPIMYPYPQEQVGKADLEVPSEVLNGPTAIRQTLQPGDVLYMPRGYVHRAICSPEAPSFHVTVALATQDWTLAGEVSQQANRLLHNVMEYRKALPREHCMQDWSNLSSQAKKNLEQQVEQALELLKNQITAQSVHANLQNRIATHNKRAFEKRQPLEAEHPRKKHKVESSSLAVVGWEAARQIHPTSLIRVATDQEKKLAQMAFSSEQSGPGLQVRECLADNILSLLHKIRSNAECTYQVNALRGLLKQEGSEVDVRLCDLTIISFVKVCVSLGALALVRDDSDS